MARRHGQLGAMTIWCIIGSIVVISFIFWARWCFDMNG